MTEMHGVEAPAQESDFHSFGTVATASQPGKAQFPAGANNGQAGTMAPESIGNPRARDARLVPGAGVEPARLFRQRILSPVRLPFRHPGGCADTSQTAESIRRQKIRIP